MTAIKSPKKLIEVALPLDDYTLCERKKWAEEARAYNELITSWGGIVAASTEEGPAGTQMPLGEDY